MIYIDINQRYASIFVKVEHTLNPLQTHNLITDKKVPEDVKHTIMQQALTELKEQNIHAHNVHEMRLLKKELKTL